MQSTNGVKKALATLSSSFWYRWYELLLFREITSNGNIAKNGKGLGATHQGIVEPITVRSKDDQKVKNGSQI